MVHIYKNFKEHVRLTWSHAKIGASALVLFLGMSSETQAQVASNYLFNQSTGTYNLITGGTVLGDDFNDDNIFTAQPIGFTFNFNGVDYTTFSLSSNGFIALGDDNFGGYNPISDDFTSPNVIAALARDIQALEGQGEISFETIGAAPNRTLVAQWRGYRSYNAVDDNYNFQIRLNETTNSIDIVYGSMTQNATDRTVQVGLKGNDISDFNSRETLTDWAATTSSTMNTGSCTLSTAIVPANGLTFSWTLADCLGAGNVAISAITSSSALATWLASTSGTASGYEYELRTEGAAGSGATGLVASGTTADLEVALSSLNPASDYFFYVKTQCGTEMSGWSSAVMFTTECVAEVAPTVVQDFSTYTFDETPVCWSEADGALAAPSVLDYTIGSNWQNSTGFANDGADPAVRINLYGTQSSWLISQAIDLGASGTFRAKYDMAVTEYFGTVAQATLGTHRVDVVISTDGGNTWDIANILRTYSGPGSYSNTGQIETIDLSAYTGVVKIGFVATTTEFSPDIDFHIDNFVVEAIPSCVEPTGLASSNITASSATISWTAPNPAPANGYEYVVSTTNVEPTAAGTATSATTADLTSLDANTTYYFFVRSICGAGDESAWMSSSFYTGYCIPEPSSVDNEGITNVTFGSINNTTGVEPTNYGDYSDLVTTVQQNTTVNVAITFTTGYTYNTSIYVDWNNDLDFDDAGEEVYTGESLVDEPTTLMASFQVPVDAALGVHRLRIGSADFGPVTPCYTGSYGSFEDYSINVIENNGCQNTTGTLDVTACPEVTINDVTYDAEGTYTQILTNALGCDSLLTINVTIGTSVTGSVTIAECAASYTLNGQTYNASGTYTQNLTSVFGCDSVLTVNLTLNSPITASASIQGTTIVASPLGLQYTWVDCATGLAISGATSSSYLPTAEGSYAVVAVGPGGCSDTSACVAYTFANVNTLDLNSVSLAPNPTDAKVIVSIASASAFEGTILDASGKVVMTVSAIVNGSEINVAGLESGMYFLRLENASETGTLRLIKK
jgi:hypothetical protein